MNQSPNFLDQEYAIDTPENVTFAHEVAGIGNRFIAALTDSVIILGALLLLNLILAVGLSVLDNMNPVPEVENMPIDWIEGLIIAAYALLNFLIFWGYYVLFEYLWNGQTPGKRLVNIRVVRMDGNPAGITEVMVRNLVRIVDFLPSGYGLGLLTMFFNRQARRLGDFAAGTLVIKERADVHLHSLLPADNSDQPTAHNEDIPVDEALLLRYVNIRRLTSQDYELIRETLHREQRGALSKDLILRLALTISAKLEVEPPLPAASAHFLGEVLRAYRQIRR
ncbi:MAG: RDD family protein [Caldilineaceae bacterium]|nr:RDD family protein [Caldilineaceae bacterium]